ncbi:DUF421 domain-containing protein [Planctomicrobium sp. SH661]|uniref:DUF421 domain-containing protein n=1 Tax=Planctomicrobium sp. SH661 TaxID=3448124 RepID=UPI003F5B7723
MPEWLSVDWRALFVPTEPLPETIIRGTCTYLALFLLLRVFRRQTGSVGAADLLVLILIADAAQNAMADNYSSITDGLLLVGTIIFWEYVIDWLAYHVKWFGKLVDREPLLVIEDGKIDEANLRQELMTRDDLLSQLRQKGVEHVSEVKKGFIEGDGHISVITDAPNKSMQNTPPNSVPG